MMQLRDCKQVVFIGPHEETDSDQSFSFAEEENGKDAGDGETMTAESFVTRKKRKRAHLSSSQLKLVKSAKCKKPNKSRGYKSGKKNEDDHFKHRWPERRYKLAEQSMLEVMKVEGAVFGNPILRPALRVAARKHIRDTGLLDHLLKHMDGKVAPGGTERFRRWHNTDGVMEYWLESADLVNIRQEAGVQDPFWIPPVAVKPCSSPPHDHAKELTLLKEEIAKMKRDVQKLMSKKPAEDQVNASSLSGAANPKFILDCSLLPCQETYKELIKWKGRTEQQLMEISSSLSGMQDTYKEWENWKAKIEQQLLEFSNSLSSMQASKQYNTVSPSASESWRDWLGSTDLVNTQPDGFAPWLDSGDLVDIQEDLTWLENSDLVNIEPEATVLDPCLVPAPGCKPSDSASQDPVCGRDLELLKGEVAKIKRDIHDLVPTKQEEDEADMNSNFSGATNSKLELGNLLIMIQEMYKESVKWKAKIDKQIMEISNSLTSAQDQNSSLPSAHFLGDGSNRIRC